VLKPLDKERKNYPNDLFSAGLIKRAEGDTGEIFFMNYKTGLFEKVPYVYPAGYETGD
jgi:hypothetical protein